MESRIWGQVIQEISAPFSRLVAILFSVNPSEECGNRSEIQKSPNSRKSPSDQSSLNFWRVLVTCPPDRVPTRDATTFLSHYLSRLTTSHCCQKHLNAKAGTGDIIPFSLCTT